MGTTLNAFKDYEVVKSKPAEIGYEFEHIHYIENDDIDLCASTWGNYIYPILEMASKLSNQKLTIPMYDTYHDEHIELAKARKLELIDPKLFETAFEKVKQKLLTTDDKKSADMIVYLDDVLLPRARAGLYFTQDID